MTMGQFRIDLSLKGNFLLNNNWVIIYTPPRFLFVGASQWSTLNCLYSYQRQIVPLTATLCDVPNKKSERNNVSLGCA